MFEKVWNIISPFVIITIIVGIFSFFMFGMINSARNPQHIKRREVQRQQWHTRRIKNHTRIIEYGNHTYIFYRVSDEAALCHDPDCKCGK